VACRTSIGHDHGGPVAEASTREQCIALHPGSNPGRVSSLRWLRQLRLGKPYRGEGCRDEARRAKSGTVQKDAQMSVFWLALAAFVIGIESFVIAGLLPAIASDLSISVPAAPANWSPPTPSPMRWAHQSWR